MRAPTQRELNELGFAVTNLTTVNWNQRQIEIRTAHAEAIIGKSDDGAWLTAIVHPWGTERRCHHTRRDAMRFSRQRLNQIAEGKV